MGGDRNFWDFGVRTWAFRLISNLWKIYQILPDLGSEETGMVRVIDESGEDYLYPGNWFIRLSAL
jgi:hypothetical protein